MDPAVQSIAVARGARILHAALVIGQILVGATCFFLIRQQGPLAGGSPLIGYATAGLALAILSVAFVFLRPRIPQRSTDQSPDDYWSRAEVRGAAIVIWATVEGAGLFCWIGYLMTASIVPAAVGVLSSITLFALRPSRVEGDEGV
jgi:hypothetical protein